MESKIVRRVQQVMNILPSFSPYPSSSLPLTTTDTTGSARDNEQKKSKIMVAEGAQRLSAEGGSMRGVGCPQTAGRYPPNEVSREAGAMRGASMSGAGLAIGRRDDSHKTHCSVDENRVAKLGCQKRWVGVPNWV